MTKLLPIVVVALILAALAERNSTYEIGKHGEKVYIRKDKFFLTIMAVVLIALVGLRTSYNDTYTYRYIYESMPNNVSAFERIKWDLGSNMGFNALNTVLRIQGVSTQNFLMLYAIITVGIYVWFLRKYTNNIWFTMFLFFTMGCYTFSMAAIKQCVAVAFCLVGVDRAMGKKWKSFVFWIALASTFHPYSLMYLVTPFLFFCPWTRKTFLLLTLFGTIGIGLESLLGTLINITTMLGEEYDTASFTGDGVNIFRLLVVWVPVFLSFVTRKFWVENDDEESWVIMNLTMLNAEIMFIALFGTANYFARLANYFLIFQTLAIPIMFKYFKKDSKKILVVGALIGYALYFYYAEGIIYGGFDQLYEGLSLAEYIKGLFASGV